MRWLVAATVAVLTVSLAWFDREALVSPGALSVAHSEVPGCASCHSAARRSLSDWPRAAFAMFAAGGEEGYPAHGDSAKCEGCHRLGNDALTAHNRSPAELDTLSRRASANGSPGIAAASIALQKALWPPHDATSDRVACATCHSEHGGRDTHLAGLPSARCQTCHTSTYASFSNGHPPFRDYPYAARTRIVYSHASHEQKHFSSSMEDGLDAPTSCADCHRPDTAGKLMDVRSFEVMCATCHMGDIDGSALAGSPGIRFLAAPELDQDALQECNIDIGSWPAHADGGLGPFMLALLAGDASVRAALETVAQLDLGDLSDAGPNEREAAARVAWAVKALYLELSSRGPRAIAQRLRSSIDSDISDAMVVKLGATISRDVVDAAVAASFPQLSEEVEIHREAGDPAIRCQLETRAMEVEASEPGEPNEDDTALGNDGDILGEDDDILAGEDDDILAGEDDDILAGEDDDILAGEDDDILAGEDDDILAGEDDDILAGDDDESLEDREARDAADATSDRVRPAPLLAEDWASYGGWYREDSSIFYRPAEHADRFLRTWTDQLLATRVSANGDGRAATALGANMLALMSARSTPGGCLQCHSVERLPSNALHVNWLPRRQAPEVRTFTRFAHQTHFSLLDDRGCATCHELEPESHAGYMAAYERYDSSNFAANFKSLEIGTCARCHRQKSAGEDCLLCHNYHVGDVDTALP